MEDIAKMLMNLGTTLVIVVLFLYDWLNNKKKINETLEQNSKCLDEIRTSNINTAKSLELLQRSMDTQKEFLVIHDKRCEATQNAIIEINRKIEK